jgi:hypothetical protein
VMIESAVREDSMPTIIIHLCPLPDPEWKHVTKIHVRKITQDFTQFQSSSAFHANIHTCVRLISFPRKDKYCCET